MPFPHEHAARQLPPKGFESFAREAVEGSPGVSFVLGCKADSCVVQSVRFEASKFTPEQARVWLRQHDFVASSLEPASGAGKQEPATTPAPDGKWQFKSVMRDEKLGIDFGWAYIAEDGDGGTVVDHSGEFVDTSRKSDVDAFERAAYGFAEHSRIGSDMHRRMGVSKLVESLVITPEKMAALVDDTGKTPKVAMWVGFKIHDEAAQAQSDKRPMFSIAGAWDRHPVDGGAS